MTPQIKLCGIILEIVDVSSRCDKVWFVLGKPEVGKGREILGRDQLDVTVVSVSRFSW